MNAVLYLIFGWIIGEFFHLTAWEWMKTKFDLEQKKVRAALTFIGIALIIALIGSGFYRVTTNQNIILTTITGNKIVKKMPGIGYSPLSSRQTVNMQKQLMKFPQKYEDNGYEIITSDQKPLLINSFLEYKVVDATKWGIENKDAPQKLLILFASTVKNTIQESDYAYIRDNLGLLDNKIRGEMTKSEGLYGIKVIGVNLQISDTVSVKQAKSVAEATKISSESLKESYRSEADALKTKYASLEDKDFIKYMELMNAIKEGKIQTMIVPQNSIMSYDTNDCRIRPITRQTQTPLYK